MTSADSAVPTESAVPTSDSAVPTSDSAVPTSDSASTSDSAVPTSDSDSDSASTSDSAVPTSDSDSAAPSDSVVSERLVHPFTAEWCSITACELMEEEIKKNPLITQCTHCKNGQVTLTISHLGGKKDGQTYTTLMTCSSCDGKGNVSLEKARSQLFGKMVDCKCKKSPGSKHAKDGHQVFGNDTYLCTDCSMVTQFG